MQHLRVSKGLGSTQRRLLEQLQLAKQDLPPLDWVEPSALGFSDTRSERSSFSRAARTLQARGLVERAVVAAHGSRSGNPYYRASEYGLAQGERWHLVVRLAATPLDLDDYKDARKRMRELGFRSAFGQRYSDWFFGTSGEGVHSHDPDGAFVVALPLEDSLELIRDLIARRA